MEILKESDPDMEIFIEGRDSTGEYCDVDKMTDEHIQIGDECIIFVADQL